jgi:DNA adenine methylase
MQYFGGKQRLAKPISSYINQILLPDQPYVEPFCGACNVISLVDNNRVMIANDLHKNLIAMWKQAQKDTSKFPTTVTVEDYYNIKKTGEDWEKGFVGFGCSFSGKYWNGYARNSIGTNYALTALRGVEKKIRSMTNVQFFTSNYDQLTIPNKSLIYCDPPYRNTTGYSTGKFDHRIFYEWCEELSRRGHVILMSEYIHNLPNNWTIVWQKISNKTIRNKEGFRESTIEILCSPPNS